MSFTEADFEDLFESDMWIYLLGLVSADQMGEW